jgi:hypothetical protein
LQKYILAIDVSAKEESVINGLISSSINRRQLTSMPFANKTIFAS